MRAPCLALLAAGARRLPQAAWTTGGRHGRRADRRRRGPARGAATARRRPRTRPARTGATLARETCAVAEELCGLVDATRTGRTCRRAASRRESSAPRPTPAAAVRERLTRRPVATADCPGAPDPPRLRQPSEEPSCPADARSARCHLARRAGPGLADEELTPEKVARDPARRAGRAGRRSNAALRQPEALGDEQRRARARSIAGAGRRRPGGAGEARRLGQGVRPLRRPR